MKTKINAIFRAAVLRLALVGMVISSFFNVEPARAVAGLPDLVITSVTVTDLSDNPITEIERNQNFKVNITVMNQGGDEYENCTGPGEIPGDNCTVDEIYRDIYLGPAPLDGNGCHPGNPSYSDTETTLIPSGGSSMRTIQMAISTPGTYDLYAYVDVNCAVDETNNANNVYTPQPIEITVVLSASTYMSVPSHDGWILESTETSNAGGTMNNATNILNIGDDAMDRQYRSILSFNTASLDDTAVITSVTLRVRRNKAVGSGNPINIFNGFMVDVRKGPFGGSTALILTDFRKPSSVTVGPFMPALSSGWYNINLISAGNKINKTGYTQIRLRFKLADNDNRAANILRIYSGNTANSKPQLIIEYYIP